MQTVRRTALRYMGGKWRLAPWILDHFPAHRVYCEPFGGAASVLLRKARSIVEIYNDLDGDVVNFFRVVRDHGDELRRRLEMTPYAREEFMRAYDQTDDLIERARRMVVRSFMGFGADGAVGQRRTGFRGIRAMQLRQPAHEWVSYADCLYSLQNRLAGVIIENLDGVSVMQKYDSPRTLHYVDPPYLGSTRKAVRGYKCDMAGENEHRRVGTALQNLAGVVVVSGYSSPLYDEMFKGWHRFGHRAAVDGGRRTCENIWINRTDGELFK